MAWPDELPDDVKAWDEVKNSETPEAFWQQMTEMKSHLGQSIRIPSSEAGDEDWKMFNEKLVDKVPSLMPRPNLDSDEGLTEMYKLLGHPESADKYTPPEIDKIDSNRVDAFRTIAHKHGLTQKQFQGVVAAITESEATASLEHETKHNQAMQTLRTDWGLAYDQNMGKVKNLIKATSGPQQLIEAVESNKMSADVLIWLNEVASRLGEEETNLSDDKSSGGEKFTRAEARSRLNEILGNKKHPYWVKGHPENKSAIIKVFELQKMANPEASTNINDLRAG
jgi:hypothetical protein